MTTKMQIANILAAATVGASLATAALYEPAPPAALPPSAEQIDAPALAAKMLEANSLPDVRCTVGEVVGVPDGQAYCTDGGTAGFMVDASILDGAKAGRFTLAEGALYRRAD